MPSAPSFAAILSRDDMLAALDEHAANAQNSNRVAFLKDNGALVGDLGTLFLPLLHQIHSVHSSKHVKEPVRAKSAHPCSVCRGLEGVFSKHV